MGLASHPPRRAAILYDADRAGRTMVKGMAKHNSRMKLTI
jgi:hypothetical protein